MKGLPTLIRLYRWRLDEKRRMFADLERLLAGFHTQLECLEAELRAEQELAAGSDEGRYAYPTYAEAVIGRREALLRSIAEVGGAIAKAREEVAAAFEEVKTYEIVEENGEARTRAAAARREQLRLDEIGLDMYRRRQERRA